MDEGLIAACGMNVAICSGYIAYQHDVKSIAKQVDLNAGIHPKIVSERLAHSNIGITLDTYSHVLPGLQEAAAERFDKILDESSFGDSNVSKMLASGEEGKCRPCRSRTCDTLIKSQSISYFQDDINIGIVILKLK